MDKFNYDEYMKNAIQHTEQMIKEIAEKSYYKGYYDGKEKEERQTEEQYQGEYCSIIDDDCPYENLKCDYCEVQKKVQEAKRLAEQMRKESHEV